MSFRDAVIQVLQEAGKPFHAKEITRYILSKSLGVTTGKTPAATVGAGLCDLSYQLIISTQIFRESELKRYEKNWWG
jgi:hypothetical protein